MLRNEMLDSILISKKNKLIIKIATCKEANNLFLFQIITKTSYYSEWRFSTKFIGISTYRFWRFPFE